MKKICIALVMFSVSLQLQSQTNKWVKDVFKNRDGQTVLRFFNFDNDNKTDGLILNEGNLFLIRSYFTDKQDTLLVTTGVSSQESSYVKTCDLNNDGYPDVFTVTNGGFIYSPSEKKFKFLQLPFMNDYKTSTLWFGRFNNDTLPDILVNGSIYLTNPNLTFQAKKELKTQLNILAITDLNNDGLDDVVNYFNTRKESGIFGSSGTDSLAVFYQLNKNGSFADTSVHIYSDDSHLWDSKPIRIGNETHLALGTSAGLKLLHNKGLKFNVIKLNIRNNDAPIFYNNTPSCYTLNISDIDFDRVNDLVYTCSAGLGWIKMNKDGYADTIKFIDAQNINEIYVLPDTSLQQTDVIAEYGDKMFKYKNINSTPGYYKPYKKGNINPNSIQRFKSGDEERFLFLSGSNLKYFKYCFRGDSLSIDTTRVLLKNITAFSLDTTTSKNPIIAALNAKRNAFLIYTLDNKTMNLTRTDSIYSLSFISAEGISCFDYDHNAKPDILLVTWKNVKLFRDSKNYKDPLEVATQSFSNSYFSRAYPVDFTGDGKYDIVAFEYAQSVWGNSYRAHFIDNNLKLLAKMDAFGLTDQIKLTDWDNNGKTDIISGANRLERYYYENDTIIKEQLSGTDDITALAVYNKNNFQKNVISIIEDSYSYKFYRPVSLNTDIFEFSSKKNMNIELVQKSGNDSISLIFLTDNVATLIKLRANDLGNHTLQNIQQNEFSDISVYNSSFFDYNVDGKKDITIETNKGLMVFYNEGNMNFSAKPQMIFPEQGYYLLGDFDHDQDMDLIRREGGDTYSYINDKGKYRQTGFLSYTPVNELANFDEDEEYEIIGDYKIYDVGSDGKFKYFGTVKDRIFRDRIYGSEYKLPANINGDKFTDYIVLAYDKSDTIFAVISDGKKDFKHTPIFFGDNYYELHVSDLNNDNFDDLVIATHFRDSMYILINQKDFSFKITQRVSLYDGSKSMDLYDFDGNGYTDIRFYNHELFLNTNGTLTLTKSTNHVPVSKQFADINDDKTDEFIFMQDGKISLYQWTKDEAPKLSSDLKTIRIGLGQYLNYKLPPNYVTDENPDLLNGYINWDFFSLAPDLQFNSLDKSIRSYYLPDKVGSYKYTLTFTDVLGKKVSDDFILEVVDALLSTEAIASTVSLICYPNPSTDVLNIKFPDGINSGGHISISNMEGKQMYTENLNSGSAWMVPVANFPKGVYFLIFTNKNIRAIAKFIKQ